MRQKARVKHICDNGGTATLCALDISKAFDRVNFYGLFKILVDCLFPKCFIDLLLDWFSKCTSCFDGMEYCPHHLPCMPV